MTKKEIIWRHILCQTISRRRAKFTQKELAALFGFSLSTIFNALAVPRKIGAVEVRGRFFRVRDPEKFLILWATARHLQRDIIYSTHVDAGPRTMEGQMPPGVIFGAYSAYRLSYLDVPADYDKVYVYSDDVAAVKKRFPSVKGYANLFMLKPDPYLTSFGKSTPDVQTFVDLWNLEDWYARDFLTALKEKMKL